MVPAKLDATQTTATNDKTREIRLGTSHQLYAGQRFSQMNTILNFEWDLSVLKHAEFVS
jgi:hypothetical protein